MHFKYNQYGIKNGHLNILNTEVSTSSNTGCIKAAGGIYVGNNSLFNGIMNWNNTMDDLFTLVHEVGHNMHSFFTEKTQPYQYH